ncbi:nuclear transport factor 2 family protein [Paraburkholderia tropica]|uniref:nuclear transport factor 2 family protein n=1 Tax=Paraburkholderia tropica TaxID=92647 RepID=UPI002AB0C028|nr:nuclear transport factor 2 family protein [Paraburkholderia tropica]
MNNALTQAAIEAMEQQRCDSTISGDLLGLAALLDDDLTFVHSSGYVHDKPQYLTFLAEKIRTRQIVRPQPLLYKFLPDFVLTTGHLEQSLQRRADASDVNMRALVTEVWVKRETGWKLLHLHSTRIPD